ncbi:MAG TPA: hypothetical protein VHX38_16590 [Pseudonocardiaceae bacterium]|jgi:hypothetical protein|nr:hypothetical protein [Pseudonocardiaceae bacterium]
MGEFLGAVVCPHPPLLLRELNGQIDSVPELRAACQRAVRTLLGWRPDRIVILGRDDTDRPWSLRVAQRLLGESGWRGATEWRPVSADSTAAERAGAAAALLRGPGRIALLVMADGTASRTLKAPGYLDERSFDFDDLVVGALREGDHEALTRLDDALAEELRMQGLPALHVLGAALRCLAPRRPRSTVSYVADPFGVCYFVATWQLVG